MVANFSLLIKLYIRHCYLGGERYWVKVKYQIPKSQKIRSGEKAHNIYETYKSTVIPHGHHIYAKASDMPKAKMSAYNQSDHSLPYWKCVLRCCSDFPCINISDQDTDNHNSDITPSFRFHIYHIIARCTAHGRISMEDNKICFMCKQ